MFGSRLYPPHEFEARYNEEPLIQPSTIKGLNYSLEAVRELLVREVYLGDICVKCGKVVVVPEGGRWT